MPYKDKEKQRSKQLEYDARWRKKNTEKHRKASAEWSKKNQKNTRSRNARWLAANPEKKLLGRAKYRAKKYGLEFSIDVSDIVIPNVCPILGTPMYRPSLDRIDPRKGYVKGNVWVISWKANRIKSNATLEELEKIVSALKAKLDDWQQ